MATLAELFNSPTDLEFEGTVYKLREPTIMEAGRYQRWLESEARAAAAAAIDLPEADRLIGIREANRDIATGEYAWGGELCTRSLRNPHGISKLMSIVCEDQGVTWELAKRMCEKRLMDIAQLLLEMEAGDDPEKKEMVARLLKSVGLPANYLSKASSESSTTPTAAVPPNSERSPG